MIVAKQMGRFLAVFLVLATSLACTEGVERPRAGREAAVNPQGEGVAALLQPVHGNEYRT